MHNIRSSAADPAPQRRRGAALEEALLDAAWSQLVDHGYAEFTVDGVARRAGTSRSVLARRWAGRAELAVAAIGRYFSLHPVEVPDLGDLREELALLLRRWSERATPAPIRFMLDLRNDLAPATGDLSGVRRSLAAQVGESDLVAGILRRAVARGEIDAARLTPRVMAVPIDLARSEVFLTLSALSDTVIYDILDQVFLPLVRNAPVKT